jgi:SAM-dependent methyltransferase
MKCLDVGCGGGFVAALMSDMVGPAGKVVGIDADEEILDLARADAELAGRTNVEFIKFDASASHDENYYDLVYARFVLTHLPTPEHCLDSMINSCKRGGSIVVEDIDFTGSFCYPPTSAYQRYMELYEQVVIKRGADPNIGPRLPGMLRTAGLENVQLNIVQPAHFEGDGKLMASITMQRVADSVISEKLATAEEVDSVIEGLNAAAEDSNVLIGFPRVFQVWGRRTVRSKLND